MAANLLDLVCKVECWVYYRLSVFRQDEGNGRYGNAKRAGVEYVLPSLSSLVPMNPVLLRNPFSSEAISREAFIQRIWPCMRHVRWCFLHFRRQCKKTR